MTTHNTRRKKCFQCLFALVTVATLAVPYLAFGAGPFRLRSSRLKGTATFSPLWMFWWGRTGRSDVTIIQQVQPAPTTTPKPAENSIYVPPRWVDGGYGVQVLQQGYWTVPKQAAEH